MTDLAAIPAFAVKIPTATEHVSKLSTAVMPQHASTIQIAGLARVVSITLVAATRFVFRMMCAQAVLMETLLSTSWWVEVAGTV